MSDKKTSMLFIGVGSIGERHLRCFQTSDANLDAAICEPHAALREKIAAQYNVRRAYASLDEALADSFDAALVATPAQTHIPITRRLVGRGIHCLIEKPLSTSIDGIAELEREAKAAGVVTAVAYVHRANPGLQAMRDALVSGRFGKPVHLVAVCGQNFPFFRPAYRDIYYANRATGGGAIQDALTHIFNACEWLVGPINRIAADAGHQVLEGVTVEDTVNAVTRHGNVMGSFSYNQYQCQNETTITVICERGSVRYEPSASRWRWVDAINGAWHDEPYEPLDRDGPFIRQAQNFLAAIAGKGEPLCTLAEGLQTLKVNLAALAAADDGRWVNV